MTLAGPLKPTHKAIKVYHESLAAYAGAQVEHEGATETAFQRLLEGSARSAHGWMLVPKLPVKRGGNLVRGYPRREGEAPAEPSIAEENRLSRSFALPKSRFSDSLSV